jgi:hypothetical protein
MTRARLHDRPAQLRVRPVFAQHQVQPHCQPVRHRHFGQGAMFAHRQATIEAAQLRIVARRGLTRFHQQEAQKRTALFADVSHPPATARTPTPAAAARTTDSARRLPSPPAPAARQRAVKLLRLFAVLQSFFLNSSRSVVKDRDLLKTRMKITAYNQHDVGSFS